MFLEVLLRVGFDTINERNQGKTAGIFRRCSPQKNMQTNPSGAGI